MLSPTRFRSALPPWLAAPPRAWLWVSVLPETVRRPFAIRIAPPRARPTWEKLPPPPVPPLPPRAWLSVKRLLVTVATALAPVITAEGLVRRERTAADREGSHADENVVIDGTAQAKAAHSANGLVAAESAIADGEGHITGSADIV